MSVPRRMSPIMFLRPVLSSTGRPSMARMTSPAWIPASSAADPGTTWETSAPVAASRVQRLGDARGDVLDVDPELPATDLAILDELVHDSPGPSRPGTREADAHVAARRGHDGAVDPHQLAVQADQGAARVAGIDGGGRSG